MIKYKLTRQDNTTYKNTTWEIGVSKETNGKVKKLCTNSWLHFYHTPELAILLNPIHANIINSKLWECEVEGEILDNDYGLKAGCTKMTLLKEIAKPELSFKNLIQFAYLALSDIANFTDIAKVDNFIPDFLVLVKNYLKKDCVKPSKKLISGIKNLQKWFVETDKKSYNNVCCNSRIAINFFIELMSNFLFKKKIDINQNLSKLGLDKSFPATLAGDVVVYAMKCYAAIASTQNKDIDFVKKLQEYILKCKDI